MSNDTPRTTDAERTDESTTVTRTRPWRLARRRDRRFGSGRGAIATLSVGLVVLALAVAAAGVPASAQTDGGDAATALGLRDLAVEPGETQTAAVVLTNPPAGVAGFELTLSIEADGVAAFTNASYPDALELSSDPVTRRDGRSIRLKGSDFDGELGANGSVATLATVTVAGNATGAATVTVSDVQVDAAGGDRVVPEVAVGRLTVGDAAAATDSTASGGGVVGGSGDGASGVSALPEREAIGAVAGVAAAVLGLAALAVRRRG